VPLTIGDPVLPPDPTFVGARARLPAPSPWPMRYRAGESLDLYVEAPSLVAAHPKSAEFFPFESGVLKKGVWPQQTGFAQSGLVQRLQPSVKWKGRTLAGVLVLTSADGSVQALSVNAMAGPVPDVSFGGGGNELGLLLALAFAFIGGLILNLMPCVLPILAMKALALSAHGGGSKHAHHESLAYGAGAVLSFLALGAAVIVLRAGGDAIGWGFQLQEPIAVAGFALLIFAVGLNLSGVFEVPGFGGGDALTRRSGMAGAFFTGVLAVAVAAPCTAPFMAAALGYALTQPLVVALAVFAALGLGFAAPFVIIGFSPRLLKRIPPPGAWMLRLKQVLAFPMYGASIWLVWVLANEAGADAVAMVLAAMVMFALAVWIWTTSRNASPRGRGFGAFATLVAFLAVLGLLATLFRPAAPPTLRAADSGIPHEPYTAARLEALRQENRPVFINATAAWCITCLVNERVAFSSGAVRDAFAKHHVACLIADWTSRNPEITRLLEAHGRDGVPLYLYYAPGAADAQVLPQILTESDVVKAIGG
jgi:thiol:disulfide interchange protein DsbD